MRDRQLHILHDGALASQQQLVVADRKQTWSHAQWHRQLQTELPFLEIAACE
jgi:hypothetical protein